MGTITMCDNCIAICNAIGELNQTEGSSITLFGKHPHVEIIGGWTHFHKIIFKGKTVQESLEMAVTEKRKGVTY